MGLGAVAYAFNQNLMLIIKTFKPLSMFPRLIIAGCIASLIAYAVPQAMGSGMSAITIAVESPENMQLLTTILIAKLLATLFAIGLGMSAITIAVESPENMQLLTTILIAKLLFSLLLATLVMTAKR